MTAKTRVLVVEDDPALLTLLRYNLEQFGFVVDDATDGPVALVQVARSAPDIMLLDWMLPTLSGLEVCRQLRSRPDTRDIPIIMLTARSEDADAIRGLDTGADDYVTKPFSIDALVARIRALLRRAAPAMSQAVPPADKLAFHDIALDPIERRVQRNGRRVHLGPTEYRLLEFLLRHPKRVFTREDLLNAIWGADIHVELRTVDVHVRRLRRALNAPGEMDVVRTVRSAGYALDVEEA